MGDIFYNPDIFSSDSDYVIAGFETDKLNGIDYSFIHNRMVERFTNLTQEFINESISINAKLGYEDPINESHQQACDIISDYLGVTPSEKDVYTIVKTLVDSDKMQTWVTNLKENIKSAAKMKSTSDMTTIGIINKVTSYTKSQGYRNAKILTQETTFEQLVEEIAEIQM